MASGSTSDLDHFRALLKEETQQLRQELRQDISELRQQLNSEQPTLERLLSGNRGQVMPPEMIRTFSSPLFPRSWSRHVSDGDPAGAQGPEHDDELFEWHRHPRKVQPRSNSSSPSNRFRQRGRAASKHGNSPNRQKRFGNSLLPAPQMPEDGVATFVGSRG
eukprot:s1907_g3.t1